MISLIDNTEVNQFVEDYFECFYLSEDPDCYRSDKDEDDDLVAGQISSCARIRNCQDKHYEYFWADIKM